MKAFFTVRGKTERELEAAATTVLAVFGDTHWDFAITASSELTAEGSQVPVFWRGDVEAWTKGKGSDLPEMGHPEYRGGSA